MEYLLTAFIITLAVFFFYKLAVPAGEPDFEIKADMKMRADRIIADTALNKETRRRGRSLGVKKIRHSIRRQFRTCTKLLSEKQDLLEFEKWLYEHHYFITEEIRAQKRCGYRYAKLPGAGTRPRLYALAEVIVKAGGGGISEAEIKEYVKKFNAASPLQFDEILQFRHMLGYALLEYAAILARRSLDIRKTKRRADIDADNDRIDTDLIQNDAYLKFLAGRLDDKSRTALDKLCRDNGDSLRTRTERFIVYAAKLNGLAERTVASLKQLSVLCSEDFIIELSPIYEQFMNDKTCGFRQCTRETKYVLLRRVRDLARRKHCGEYAVAAEALAISAEKQRDIAYALLPKPKGAGAMRIYVFAQLAAALLLPLFFPFTMGWIGLLVYFLLLPISYAVVIMLFASVGKIAVKRRYLPRYDIKFASPEDCATLITVPMLVASKAEAANAFRQIETIACANPARYFSYCLLLDLLPNRDGQASQEDRELIAEIRTAYERLRNKERYTVIVRARKPNAEGKWCGWEKKRGALIELNRMLLDEEDGGHTVFGKLPAAVYVITLDSDTLFNRGEELVGIMLHPFNKEINVVGLGMRTENGSAQATLFSNLFSGAKGLHSYSEYLSDPANDLFGHGNFTGKGIYRVREFHALTGAAFRENTLLSHDFIEGAYAGYGDSGLFGMDAFPSDFSAFLARKLRWLRGDFQFLPYLKSKVRNMAGEKVENPLTPIDKQHIAAVTVFGFLPLSSLAVTITALFTTPLLLLAAFALPILSVLASVRRSALNGNLSFFGELLRQFFALCFLPAECFYSVKAVVVTMYRLMRGRNLMDWKVAAHYKGHMNLWPCIAFGAALIAAAVFLRANPVFYVLGIVNILAVIFDKILSRKKKPMGRSETLDALLKDEARRIWEYFSAQLTEENNFLPCDNYSESAGMWIYRTSPTDIGMAFLAVVSACTLGFIPYDEAATLAEHMTSSLESAPKWRGHLYNWMNTDLTVLEPKYVSTVDSGNLMACLRIAANRFPALKDRLSSLIEHTDMEALMDCKRGLLRIGYNETEDTYDESHYDLMGSESTSAYLTAIGGGMLAGSSWDRLSRRTVRYAGKLLYAWTGGLFEYLLSSIFFRYPENGLFGKTARNAVRSHIRYAKKRGLRIWGLSECQYTEMTPDGNYRYKAFGVPYIALHGEDGDVIAPYACIMAARYDPKAAEKNLKRMIDLGARGKYGFYEAVAEERPVLSYMSHHKGMAMAAICNYLCDDALIAWTESDGAGRAAELLLSEPAEFGRSRRKILLPRPDYSDIDLYEPLPKTKYPQYNFITNGNYHIVIDERMCGYAYFDGFLTRFRNRYDGIRIRISVNGREVVPIAKEYSPVCALYEARSDTFAVSCAVRIYGDNGEMREISLKNKTAKPLSVAIYTNVPLALGHDPQGCADPLQLEFINGNGYAAARKKGELSLIYGHRVETDDTVPPAQGCKAEYIFAAGIGSRVTLDIRPHAKERVRLLFTAGYSIENVEAALKNPEASYGEQFALCGAYVPNRETAELGSMILGGAGSSVLGEGASHVDPRLPVVCLENGNALAERLGEIAKLYAFGLSFQTVIFYEEEDRYSVVADAIFTKVRELEMSANGRITALNRLRYPAAAEDIKKGAVGDRNTRMARLANTAGKQPAKTMPMPPAFILRTETGGFDAEGSFITDEPVVPAAILADGVFGTEIGENGSVRTWYGNHEKDKLTDSDIFPAEFVVLGDRGLLWSIAPSPVGKDCVYRKTIHPLFVEFRCDYDGITARERQLLIKNKKTKIFDILLTNNRKQTKKLDLMLSVNPVLGDNKLTGAHNIELRRSGNALKAVHLLNKYEITVESDQPLQSYAFHKEAFTEDGTVVRNAELEDRGSDKNLAYCIKTEISGGSSVRVLFSVSANGYDFGSYEEDLSASFRPTTGLTVETGAVGLDLFITRLQYERAFEPRSRRAVEIGPYLTDCLAYLFCDPSEARKRLTACAAHQFEDGEILCSWDARYKGDRSNDERRLLLPYMAAEYLDFTGDLALTEKRIPYLEDSEYGIRPQPRAVSFFDHCIAAIFGTEVGADGLMLCGGKQDAAATMFLLYTIARFMPYIRNTEIKLRLSAIKKRLTDGLERCWDGEWYACGPVADKDVKGSADCTEGSIQLWPQALAIFSGVPEKHARRAALSACAKLVDRKEGVIRYLYPPYSHAPAGVRRNGGQDTLCAVWYIKCLFALGEPETAYKLIRMIDPVDACVNGRAPFPAALPEYLYTEAYSGAREGQAGAALLYKCIIEDMLGIKLRGKRILFAPALPAEIRRVRVRLRAWDLTIEIDNTAKGDTWCVSADGIRYNTDYVTLNDSLRSKTLKIVKAR